MKTYCEGSQCSKRDKCALHYMEENKMYEYIDWSTYGSGRYWNDPDGTPHCEIEARCGDEGNFKCFVEVKSKHTEPNQKLKIKDLNFGNKFIINDKKYMLIDMDISSCFISTAGKESTIASALDMKNFKIYCFDKETEIKILEEK